jgi:hypothetical protein
LWITGKCPTDLRRPDRSHYIIDTMPDRIQQTNNETGEIVGSYAAIQVWVDPKFPDAHKDKALRVFLNDNGLIAIVRYDDRDGFVLFPPSTTADEAWHEERGQVVASSQSPFARWVTGEI